MSAIFDENQQFIDPTTDTLLVGGKIYIGTAGLDPVVNEKSVYDNRELTGSPLAQPVIIDANGRATTKMWVSGKYSVQIDSSADVQKYQELQNGFDEAVGNIQTTGSLGVNAITVTGSPVQSAYVDNKTYIVTAPADNTGAMTINIDSIGVIDIRKAHDQAIASGDVKADMKLQLIYNSTDGWMELQSAVLGSVFLGGIAVTGGVATDTVTATGNITSGDRFIGSAGNDVDSGLFVIKAADESVTASTTLQDDDDLTFVLAADSVYDIQAILIMSSASATPNAKYVFLETDGAWIGIFEQGATGGGGVASADVFNQTLVQANVVLAAGEQTIVRVKLTASTGVSGGEFKLQWAQLSSNATASTVEAGSWMKATKLA